jgi:phage tail sheath protein FI
MPITPTYPGIYIEELPSTEKTITAAPTSITVFIGYTHPFKTAEFGKPVRIFSFTDYERNFGGFFQSSRVPAYVPLAVQQFFLNGGADAYVVGLDPGLDNGDDGGAGTDTGVYSNPPTDATPLKLIPLEPTDTTPVEVTIDNIQTSGEADISITYGTRAETYRRVALADITTTISGSDASSLVKVTADAGLPAAYEKVVKQPIRPSSAGATVFATGDFTDVFATDGLLDKVDIFNLLVIPGISDTTVLSYALAFCERKQAFLIMDPPQDATADGMGEGLPEIATVMQTSVPKSPNGALYFPYLKSLDPATGEVVAMPPSGFVAGIYARTDNNRGVWKAPAGLETIISNTTGVPDEGKMTDPRAGVLNSAGVNAIRTFPGVGTVVFGARTLVTENTALQQWRYVPVRRMALFLEQTLKRNLGWVVFEPNDERLWVAVRTSIDSFMLSMFRQGAFFGTKPSEAFLVKCDSSTTTTQDINNGVVNILVGFRPLKPAEFVVIKIAQLAGQAQS